MPTPFLGWPLRHLNRVARPKPSRLLYSVNHRRLGGLGIQDRPKQGSPAYQTLCPYGYHHFHLEWRPLTGGNMGYERTLSQGEVLRVVSWNIDSRAPGLANRASAAIHHLKDLFGDYLSRPMVVMPQEVRNHSLAAILAQRWVQSNFYVSAIESFQQPSTFMLVSKHLRFHIWFRVPLESRMGKEALCVDIEVSPCACKERIELPRKYLRLCTTHLELDSKSESESERNQLRSRQLTQISVLLHEPITEHKHIVGGIVGGDMNSTSPLHDVNDVELSDVWQQGAPECTPAQKHGQKDLAYGRAYGNTWAYQSEGSINHKRTNKLFSTGLETVALTEPQDLSGKVGRLGIGVKTRCAALGDVPRETKVIYESLIDYPFNYRFNAKPQPEAITKGVQEMREVWISDHFGIAIGVKIR
ncbi:MAG: hypothetical protein Q9201_001466 [Fulgogasparrea decipioides]